MRQLIADAGQLLSRARNLTGDYGHACEAVRQALTPLLDALVADQLEHIPPARLTDVTHGNLRVESLAAAGYHTVGQILAATQYQLLAIPGIGVQTAAQIQTAAAQIAAAARESTAIRLDVDDREPGQTELVVALSHLVAAGPDLSRACSAAASLEGNLTEAIAAARPARSRLRMLLRGTAGRARVQQAVQRLRELLAEAAAQQTGLLLLQASTDLLRAQPADEAWASFEVSAAEFYSALASVSVSEPDSKAAEGHVPDELSQRVRRQGLDETYRRVSLRGYQAFGARFALAQQRAIIGDEMGLGKSIEAIAVLAHLRSAGHTHFLVVCPVSVLVTWLREISARSQLNAYRLYGPAGRDVLATWAVNGGVAVTTIDSLHGLDVPASVPVSMLVVDEAHYVKNPRARRSQAVAAWSRRVERVLFLTGTPLENQISDFLALIGYLQPDLADRMRWRYLPAEEFRAEVSPVYLRRNQKDVLAELPRLIRIDDWVSFSRADMDRYRAAVTSGNFMAMRSAAYADPAASAKLNRLREIVKDAAEHDLKVVVFSYFVDVLDAVYRALGPTATGPLTGSLNVARRQQMVDAFTSASGHAVLLSQIQSGGTGINLQAASVVILCEPQIKPALEHQAIGRAHRMGQVRAVRAHRLLAEDSVDESLLKILARKDRIFDDYARRSDLAESSTEAIDATDPDVARQIVEAEQLRFAKHQAEKGAS